MEYGLSLLHEGNPSTQDLIEQLAKPEIYILKLTLEWAYVQAEMLQQIAANNWAEYFYGSGTDQIEVLQAKSKFADLDPPNA